MKTSRFEKMTSELLFSKRKNYGAMAIILTVLAIALLVLGTIPEILGTLYPSNAFFEILFVICFVFVTRSFMDWRAVRKEIKKRGISH